MHPLPHNKGESPHHSHTIVHHDLIDLGIGICTRMEPITHQGRPRRTKKGDSHLPLYTIGITVPIDGLVLYPEVTGHHPVASPEVAR